MSDNPFVVGCSCERKRVPPEAFGGDPEPEIYIVHEDDACPRHGDGTEFRANVQRRAREIAEWLGLSREEGT